HPPQPARRHFEPGGPARRDRRPSRTEEVTAAKRGRLPSLTDFMDIAAADLARILDLYTRGLYVQAYHLGNSFAPLADWTGTSARLLAGRLARQPGAPPPSR